jgi:carbon storage regulator CsrA
MLVLSRKDGESVIVGGGSGFPCLCKVTVLGVTAGRVRLGFQVDAGVPVNREEVWERICAEESRETMDPAAMPPLLHVPRKNNS